MRSMIMRLWGDNVDENEEERVVGTVAGTDISRRLLVFRLADDEGWVRSP